MKQNTVLIIALVVAVLVISGIITIPQIDLSNLIPGTTETGLVNVNKQLKFAVTDKYAGSAKASVSNGITIYDSDGETQLEQLSTGSDGTVNTAFTYPSGKKIYVKWVDSNNKVWFELTVPQMNAKDAEAATYNNVHLEVFSIGTYTSDSLKYGATSISDAGSYNFTASGTTQTFTYSLANTGNDNTGLMASYDPIYDSRWDVVIYITFSGTGYEQVIPYGFSKDFTLGTTHYVANILDPYKLTKHKVGNIYKSTGTTDITFTLDGTGYAHGGATTMQIYVYAYSDPDWCAGHGGNFGVSKVQLAEHTVSLLE